MPDLRPDAIERMVDWTALIDDVSAGRWINPDTGRPAEIPFKTVVIAESLAGRQADLVRQALPATSYAVVADKATYDVYGAEVLKALGPAARAVVLDHPHADAEQVRRLQAQTRDVDALIAAVGRRFPARRDRTAAASSAMAGTNSALR